MKYGTLCCVLLYELVGSKISQREGSISVERILHWMQYLHLAIGTIARISKNKILKDYERNCNFTALQNIKYKALPEVEVQIPMQTS